MPRGDGTGPAGQGPMTGRGLGFCVSGIRRIFGNRMNRTAPRSVDQTVPGTGLGAGYGVGRGGQGRGAGRGRGQGRGRS